MTKVGSTPLFDLAVLSYGTGVIYENEIRVLTADFHRKTRKLLDIRSPTLLELQ